MDLVVVTPVYNDWECFQSLIQQLEIITQKEKFNFVRVIAVNDGSSAIITEDFSTSLKIEILNLSSNLGHQRAIAIGLSYANQNITDFDYLIVLDCDGEDKPSDIVLLINKCQEYNSNKIIFAARKKRTESIEFKTLYFIYKFLFALFTKNKINFGNFSCIPQKYLKRIVTVSDIWNHYSGSVIKSRIPYKSIPLDRGFRYHSKSKMNLQNLMIHGFSSIAIYLDTVSVRLFILCLFGITTSVIAVFVIIIIKLFTDLSIPGWASSSLLALINLIGIFAIFSFLILLMQLNQRNHIQLPPSLLYHNFILDVQKINL